MKKIIYLIIILNIQIFVVSAQTTTIDSLKNILSKHTTEDTIRVNLLIEIANAYTKTDKEESLIYAEKAGILSDELSFLNGKAESLRLTIRYHWLKGNYPNVLDYLHKYLIVLEKIGNQLDISSCLNNLGAVYIRQSNYPKALECLQKSLIIREEIDDPKGISTCLANIGVIYKKQKEYALALEYYQRALKIREEIGYKEGCSNCMSNIGIIYRIQNNYPKALEYYTKALEIYKEIDDKKGIANILNNIGLIHYYQENNDLALDFIQQSLAIREKIDNKFGLNECYFSLGGVYLAKNNNKKALEYVLKSLEISNELEMLENQAEAYEQLAKIYVNLKDYKKAYESYFQFKKLKDSIFNENNIKEITNLENQYEYDKEKQAIELEQQKKEAIYEAEAKQQKNTKNFFIIGFILMIMLVSVVFISFLLKRKANKILAYQKIQIEETNEELNQTNEELNATLDTISMQKGEIILQRDNIEKQKNELHKKNKNITHSINYAKRIQDAILPSHKIFEKYFSEHFILFKPRDLVSGDFYWAKEVNDSFIFTVADCTGHGVPGAFVSMLGITLLNEIVRHKKITQASQVLDELRKNIKNSLHQKGYADANKDGMDMALCVINTKTNILQYAGAYNPLYLIKNEELIINNEKPNSLTPKLPSSLNSQFTNSLKNLITIIADKQPVAIHIRENPFTNHVFQLKKDDVLYLFTDGYADQFGGEDDNKFYIKQFKKLLLSIQNQNLQEQKQTLEHTFNNWQGENRQLDDVLVMGVKM